jgi:hypothetical protein
MDLTVVAYATLALSLLVSAFKIGGSILNADARAIVNAGRWILAGLPLAALGLLVWLAATGRWTAATFLAAFLLPVMVQALPRWRLLLPPLYPVDRGLRPFATDIGGSVVAHDSAVGRPSSELVAQSIAVLRDYLEQNRIVEHGAPLIVHDRAGTDRGTTPQNGSGAQQMSTQEAFEVLGLRPTPSPREVKAAHRRLEQVVAPQHGGSPYLLMKINEARDVLLGE